MYCKQCGSHLPENCTYCPHCGASQTSGYNYQQTPYAQPFNNNNPTDTGSAGWGVLGFFFPIVGFILWLVWRHDRPRNARSAGIGTLVSVILYAVSIILYIVVFVVMLGALGGAAGDMYQILGMIL